MLEVQWILADTEWLAGPKKYAVEGIFYLHTEAGDFPCTRWKTLPAIILSDMINSVLQLVQQKDKKIIVPLGLSNHYYCLLQVQENNICNINFLRRYIPEPLDILPPIILSYSDLCHILYMAGETMLQEYHAKKIGVATETYALATNVQKIREKIT